MTRVAQIQFDPKLGDCYYNRKKVESFLNKSGDADLIVLPELANSGYNFKSREHAIGISDQKDCEDYLSMLCHFANENNTHIVSGYLERIDDKLYNSSVFISPNGIAGNYRKIHLFMNEKDVFEDGNQGLPLFSFGEYKLGMLICFDYLFPEIWRAMGLNGADLIVHPSNLITQNAFISVPAHALNNGYYIITSNRTGVDGDLSFCGQSFIADTRGNVISKMGLEEEGIMITEIDLQLSRNKMVTPRNHIFDDRKPEYY